VILSQGGNQFSGGSWGEIIIWVSSSGVLTAYTESTSKSAAVGDYAHAFNNGSWYFPTVVLNHSTLRVYSNGVQDASGSDHAAPATSANYLLGYTTSALTFNQPDSPYFQGSLAGIAVFPSALGSGAVSSLYGQTTFSGYTSDVLSRSPSEYWALQDSGASPYTGPLPGVSGSIGNYMDVTASFGSTCLYPYGSGACPAPSGTDTLAGFAPSGSAPLPVGGSGTLVVSAIQDPSTPATAIGIDVLAEVDLSESIVDPVF
jgi:hypothetical protein